MGFKVGDPRDKYLCIFEDGNNGLVYYDNKVSAREFLDYDLIVFDSEYHPPLRPLIDRGKTLLGYISLGEAEQVRDYFEEDNAQNILIPKNKSWKGSYFVDVRSPLWAKRVIEDIIPAILHKGFNGIFLDTLDNPPSLERDDPKKYKGMTEAAANLVKAIRLNYPDIKIMMNRGYELLPYVGDIIDMELGESVYADYDFDKKEYGLVEDELYKTQLEFLNKAKKDNPELKIYSLDYWDPDDRAGISKIYAEQRKNGYSPYVATVELNKIIGE